MNATGTLNGLRKAAVLIVVLGEDAAAEIYRHLHETEVQQLTHEIAELEYVPPHTAMQVLEEYQRLSVAGDCMAQGGTRFATKLLKKAFGVEGSQELLAQVSRAAEISASKLDSLHKADPQQLAKFLENEHPQTITLMLAHLDAKQASLLLMRLPESMRGEVVRRLAQLRLFSPDMAQKVAVALHKRLQALGEQSRRAYAGVKGVAELLNGLAPAACKTILEAIEREDPKLAISIRNLMFTFEDLLTVPETGLRELLGLVDKKSLATALKGGSEELKNHFFKCMSSRAVEMLKEDMDVLGPVRGKEVAKAQQEMLDVARKLEAEGKLSLKPETEDEYVM